MNCLILCALTCCRWCSVWRALRWVKIFHEWWWRWLRWRDDYFWRRWIRLARRINSITWKLNKFLYFFKAFYFFSDTKCPKNIYFNFKIKILNFIFFLWFFIAPSWYLMCELIKNPKGTICKVSMLPTEGSTIGVNR